MRITYDREADAVYIELVNIAPGDVVAEQELVVGDDEATVNLDFDRNGFLLGIEVLHASAILNNEVLTKATDITRDK